MYTGKNLNTISLFVETELTQTAHCAAWIEFLLRADCLEIASVEMCSVDSVTLIC